MDQFIQHNLRYVIFFISTLALAQSRDAAYIYDSADHRKVDRYEIDNTRDHLVLKSDFSEESVQQIPFTDQRISQIDLVYTTFSELEDFNQKELDISRIANLIAINPRIIDNRFFDWNIIGQEGCQTSAACQSFFHGFVIYYDPYFTKEVTRKEVDSIKTELSDLEQKIASMDSLLAYDYNRIACEYPESYYSIAYLTDQLGEVYDCAEKYSGRVFFEIDVDYKGRPMEVRVGGNLFPCKARLSRALKYITKWKRGLVIGNQQYPITIKGFVSYPLKKESISITGYEIDPTLIDRYQMLQQYAQCVAYDVDTTLTAVLPFVEQRVVSSVLTRNKWDAPLIVVDVTGSMFPYTADLLKWIRLYQPKNQKTYVFFNDGNDLPTGQKVVGKTGGIAHVTTDDFSAIKKQMFSVMYAGGGGDVPENNFEALAYGVETANAQDAIMIADNRSFPRDFRLAENYSGKLKIILCHTEKGINTRYLDLARKYGFTLHTMDSDIKGLERYQKSERLRIDGRRYAWDGEQFVMLRY